MKFSGTPAQMFAAVQAGATRFQGIGQTEISHGSPATSVVALAAGTALGYTVGRHQRDKQLAGIVRREVKKALHAHQPKGLSFDLFG